MLFVVLTEQCIGNNSLSLCDVVLYLRHIQPDSCCLHEGRNNQLFVWMHKFVTEGTSHGVLAEKLGIAECISHLCIAAATVKCRCLCK